jgi:hypothetical protein
VRIRLLLVAAAFVAGLREGRRPLAAGLEYAREVWRSL